MRSGISDVLDSILHQGAKKRRRKGEKSQTEFTSAQFEKLAATDNGYRITEAANVKQKL